MVMGVVVDKRERHPAVAQPTLFCHRNAGICLAKRFGGEQPLSGRQERGPCGTARVAAK